MTKVKFLSYFSFGSNRLDMIKEAKLSRLQAVQYDEFIYFCMIHHHHHRSRISNKISFYMIERG